MCSLQIGGGIQNPMGAWNELSLTPVCENNQQASFCLDEAPTPTTGGEDDGGDWGETTGGPQDTLVGMQRVKHVARLS